MTRGVPGTHNIKQLSETLDALMNGDPVKLPRFNKATDDGVPESSWPEGEGDWDIILLEGWCVGCRPVAQQQLRQPTNQLEASEDAGGEWRSYVNECLGGAYADLFHRLDALVMLCAPSMEQVLQWRRLQESKLARSDSGNAIMSATEVQRFVQHYERITRHALAEMPSRADYLLQLDAAHNIASGGPA